MATLLNDGMSGGKAVQGYDSDGSPDLDEGESYCSPEEEQLLQRVMAAVYRSVNTPKALHSLRGWFLQHPDNLGVTIGNVAFTLLFGIYKDAQQAGTPLPVTVFIAQGGAVYQTIDMLINIAEHCGVKVDPDQCREDAIGYVLDKVKQNHDLIEGNPQGGGQQLQRAQLPQQAASANPLSSAVSQGLMGGAQ